MSSGTSKCFASRWVDFPRGQRPKTHPKSLGFMQDRGISRMDWPACRPDMNPIENIWSWIKRKIDLKSPRNLIELADVLNDTWNSLEPEFLEPFWTSMHKRVKLVISSGGIR